MIKGCSRRMIVLKDTGSDFFEEAYFVLKSHKTPGKIRTEQDFVAEANRIVAEASNNGIYSKKQEPKSNTFLFLFGVLCGIAVCSIAILIIKSTI